MAKLPWRCLPVRSARFGRLRRALTRDERGFTMAEIVIAMVIFEIVGASLILLLSSATAATRVARHRTVAQQAALSQIESIRALPYAAVGVVGGNPAGCLGVTSATTACPQSSYPSATTAISNGGLIATMKTTVSYVNDPGPLSYTSYANYKKVVVTVTRTLDSKVYAHEVTYIAPPVKADQTKAVIKAQVVDYGNNNAVANVPVALATGPSAPESDSSDAGGNITFAGLTPNPTSGGQAYYDLSLTPPSGYVTLYDTVSPAAPAHVQLSPGQTWQTALNIYKPATVFVQFMNYDGTTFAGPASVTLSYTRKSTPYAQIFPYAGSPLTITSMTEGTNTVQLIPGLSYTATVSGTNFYPNPPSSYTATANVPDAYPTTLTHTFAFTGAQLATVTATVKRGATLCSNATVTVTGGPWGGPPWNLSRSATTVSGVATITNVPVGTGYTIRATETGLPTQTSTTTVVAAPTTQALPNPLSFGSTTGAC
jgi:hypothetical protein